MWTESRERKIEEHKRFVSGQWVPDEAKERAYYQGLAEILQQRFVGDGSKYGIEVRESAEEALAWIELMHRAEYDSHEYWQAATFADRFFAWAVAVTDLPETRNDC